MDHTPVSNGPLAMSAAPVAPARPLGRAAPPPAAQGARATTFTLTRAMALPYVWAVARLMMAWTFLWPFFDKLIGLNHQTTTAQAWINGGNPTKGFLSGSVGFLSGFYTSIAGAGIVDWLFMVGLLAVGITLAFGIAIRFAAVAGSIMLLAMWSASLPPSDDLILDNHIIYVVLLIGLALVGAGSTLGFGRRWAQTTLVQRYPWLT
jgi:thiosulfate dehydrogenase (quinone) large subunit